MQIVKKSLKPTLFAADQKTNLRISGDFPVRLTTKPIPGTLVYYEKSIYFSYIPQTIAIDPSFSDDSFADESVWLLTRRHDHRIPTQRASTCPASA